MEQEQPQYEVRILGKVILRGRIATRFFLLFVFFSPLGFILWPEGGSSRLKWIHRLLLAASYLMVYIFIRLIFFWKK